MDRPTKKQKFLDSYFQTWYNLEPMIQDASFRKYDRVVTPTTSYVLMDSPPEHYSTKPFEHVGEWLLKNNLSAPQIFHKDSEQGFLLLEDFGDTLLQHVLEEDRKAHYIRAIDLLIELHKIEPPEWLPKYTNDMMLKELEIFTDYYSEMSISAKDSYLKLWESILNSIPNLGSVIVLKDYHVQNLMHLADREGVQSLGILDFQDAVIGSPIYDIVSILEDARESVDFAFAKEIFEYYLDRMPHINRDKAYLSYDILGAQRNIRILGVFARKKIRDGSDNYLHLIPRVLHYVERDLQNLVMSDIKKLHKGL